MNPHFYILGLLIRHGPQHAYQMKQILEEDTEDLAGIQVPTIYYHLGKLKNSGYISVTADKESGRPEKMIYSITEKGEDYFFKLLKKMQVDIFEIAWPLDAAVFRKNRMDMQEFSALIKNAIQEIESILELAVNHKDKNFACSPDEYKYNLSAIFDHHIYHLQADLKWLREQEINTADDNFTH